MRKSVAFGVLHLVIAITVGYAISGSFVLAGAIALVEPLVNTVAHYFFDRWWNERESAAAATSAADASPVSRQDVRQAGLAALSAPA